MEKIKKAVYGAAIIRMRYYWPLDIDENNIKDHFADNDVGAMDALCGYLDIVPLCIFTMKEEDYVMTLM